MMEARDTKYSPLSGLMGGGMKSDANGLHRRDAGATPVHRRDAGATRGATPAGANRKSAIGNRKCPRGAALLEVLVSMGLLIFGLAMVGLQINAGLDAARSADIGTRGVMLVDTKLAELEAGVLRPERDDQELKGDFGLAYPGYTWRLHVKETEIDDFYMVTLDIGFNPVLVNEQVRNPDLEIDIEDGGTQIIQTAYRLFPKPADVNLERDFGITGEKLTQAREAGNGGGGSGDGPGGGGGDGEAGNLRDELLALLESLAGGSFDPRMLSDLPEEVIEQYRPYLEMLLGRRASPGQSPEDALRDMLGGRRGGGRGRDRVPVREERRGLRGGDGQNASGDQQPGQGENPAPRNRLRGQ